jgi:hypothetical protein
VAVQDIEAEIAHLRLNKNKYFAAKIKNYSQGPKKDDPTRQNFK